MVRKRHADRAAENHYPVSRDAHTDAEIVAERRNVSPRADDCVCFMWVDAGVRVLHRAIERGLRAKTTAFTRASYASGQEQAHGLGYWSREKPEDSPDRREPGTLPAQLPALNGIPSSWRRAPNIRQSRKVFTTVIERLVRHCPKSNCSHRRQRAQRVEIVGISGGGTAARTAFRSRSRADRCYWSSSSA